MLRLCVIIIPTINFCYPLKVVAKLVQLVVPLYGRTSWGALTTTTGGYEDDANDDVTLMPTGNDDATDEGAIAGTLLLDNVTASEDGKTEILLVDGHAVADVADAIAAGGGAANAVASTNGVDTDEFKITCTWLGTAAVDISKAGTIGTV